MAVGGDAPADAAFAALIERHTGELRVHCYRMTGSLAESEELVQETFIKAWRKLDGFEGRSSIRAWLYRIATNACLDALSRSPPRVLPDRLGPPSDPSVSAPPRTDLAWLQPFPDSLLEALPAPGPGPEEAALERETIELAFIAAIQHLPPRQRAAVILADVLGWSSAQIGELLGSNEAAVNSALRRARRTLRRRLPRHRSEWAAGGAPSPADRATLHAYMEAIENADLDAMARVLAAEVKTTMPPLTVWFEGRDAVLGALATSWDPASPAYVGRFRLVEIAANRQPVIASFVRTDETADFTAFAINVLTIADGRLVEATAFHDPSLFAAFGLPTRLRDERDPDDPPAPG